MFSSIVAYGQGVVCALGQDITSSASTVISTVQSVFNAFAGPQSPDIIDLNASLGLSDISDAGVDNRPDAYGGRETAMELGEQFGHKLSLAIGILGMVTGGGIIGGAIAAVPATAGLSLVVSAAGVVLGVTVAGVSVALVAEAVQGIAYSVTSPAPTPAMSSQTGGGSQRPFRQEVPNPAVLRRRMRAAGIEEPEKPFAAHHIVAGKAPGANKAREILDKFEILINDANNGVYLPTDPNANWGTYHRSLHTEEYYKKVTAMLSDATTRDEVIAILQEIAELPKAGEFI